MCQNKVLEANFYVHLGITSNGVEEFLKGINASKKIMIVLKDLPQQLTIAQIICGSHLFNFFLILCEQLGLKWYEKLLHVSSLRGKKKERVCLVNIRRVQCILLYKDKQTKEVYR